MTVVILVDDLVLQPALTGTSLEVGARVMNTLPVATGEMTDLVASPHPQPTLIDMFPVRTRVLPRPPSASIQFRTRQSFLIKLDSHTLANGGG